DVHRKDFRVDLEAFAQPAKPVGNEPPGAEGEQVRRPVHAFALEGQPGPPPGQRRGSELAVVQCLPIDGVGTEDLEVVAIAAVEELVERLIHGPPDARYTGVVERPRTLVCPIPARASRSSSAGRP